jgi:hypothetical protein
LTRANARDRTLGRAVDAEDVEVLADEFAGIQRIG